MKKIYISLSAALIATAGIAQTQKSIVERYSANRFELNTKGFTQMSATPQTKAGGGIIAWSDDFTTAANWTIDNDGQTTADFGWAIGTSSTSWANLPSIASTSGGAFAELNNGDPSANSTTPPAIGVTYTMTTTSPIDVSTLAGTDNVSLSFQQNGARFLDAQEVYVSVDGTTWVLVHSNNYIEPLTDVGGSAYTNPTTEIVNITSAITGGASSVWIRFSWTSEDTGSTDANDWITYGWQIDDVSIVTNDDNNNTLNTAVMGQGAFQLPYYLLATSQIAPITFSGNVTNNGAADQPNTSLEVTAEGNVYASTPALFPTGGIDSLVTSTNYTPSSTNGIYPITYELVSDSIDFAPGDNIASKSIQVNEFIYARDEAGINALNTTGSISNIAGGTGQSFRIGNVFEVMNSATLHALDAKFTGTLPTGGAIVFAELYQFDVAAGAYVFIEGAEEILMETTSMMSQVQTFRLLNTVDLVAGDEMLVIVGHYGSDIAIATAGDAEQGTVLGYDASNSPFSLIGPSNVCVRMNFDPSVGIVENEAAGIKLGQNVPNPFNNNTTVNFELSNSQKVTFTVTDLTGKVVENIDLGNLSSGNHSIQLNANSYSNGIYYYTMSTGAYQVTNKMMIQK